MRKTFKLGSWLAAVGLAVSSLATPEAAAQDCVNGKAIGLLDINNVRAPLFTTGSLFFPDFNGVHYEVPKGSRLSPNFATHVWIGGLADGELRIAAGTYGQGGSFDYYPGPLPANGTPLTKSQCENWDRIWKVDKTEVASLNRGGSPSRDILEWPWQAGAPVVDGDGVQGNYNLAGGDRPQVIGDQTLWWVMNDASGPHGTQGTPVGIEVQVSAFAFRAAGPLNSMTFYKYKLIYKPRDGKSLRDTYMAVWADTDLGDAADDYVGVDTTLGMAFTYNADNADTGSGGYGSVTLPAFGIDFFQGPLVAKTGSTFTDPDGTVHQNRTRLKATRFVYYNNDGSVTGNPSGALDHYRYMTGLWRDGQPIQFGGNGRVNTEGRPATFMFPGNPPNYWSEDKPTPTATAGNTPADRRFIVSTGPFVLAPGESQELVFGMVFSQSAQGATNPRIAAVQQLKSDDAFAQRIFDLNFTPTTPPDPVDEFKISEQDGRLVLVWNNLPTNNNFANQYEARDVFLPPGSTTDSTYQFEGYKLYQYRDKSDVIGRLIRTYDVANGITTVVDEYQDAASGRTLTQIVANGTDSGIENFLTITSDAYTGEGLRNYTEYCFGVVAYGYNAASTPKIIESAPQVTCAVPQRITADNGGQRINAAPGDTLRVSRVGAIQSEGVLVARVADPLALTGDTYQVRFDTVIVRGESLITYTLVNTTKNTTLFDGKAFSRRTGESPAYGQNLFTYDGISFSIDAPPPGYKDFLMTRNAAGPLNPPGDGAQDPNHTGFPNPSGDGTQDPLTSQQANGVRWGFHTFCDAATRPLDQCTYTYFLSRTLRDGGNIPELGSNDYEMRFTATGGYATTGFGGTAGNSYPVPFELWDVGTKPDASDDVRLIPLINENPTALVPVTATTRPTGPGNNRFDLGQDHPTSGGNNDPQTDWVYWYRPVNKAPGDAGYKAYENVVRTQPTGYDFAHVDSEIMARVVLATWNAGAEYSAAVANLMPETGTTFRIVTAKPFLPGEVLTFNTSTASPTRNNADLAKAALEDIGVVPNPYRGRSDYDVSNFQSQVRFVNIPTGSLVRVYTLSGQLIKTFTSGGEDFIPWDLRTDSGLPIASGLYLVHVDVPNVGQKVIKFGVVQRRIQLDTF